jgi:hypothetical protein
VAAWRRSPQIPQGGARRDDRALCSANCEFATDALIPQTQRIRTYVTQEPITVSKSNGIQSTAGELELKRPFPSPPATAGRTHLQTEWGNAPRKGVAFRGSRQLARRRGRGLQASRHSEKAVASLRRPPQIPQVRHGSTTERRTSASAGVPARPLPRARRAEVRRGGSTGGRGAALSGRGPAVAGRAEARRVLCIIADVGDGVDSGVREYRGYRGVYLNRQKMHPAKQN